MCKIYRISTTAYKDLPSRTILGIGGFNIKTTELFLITYDISAFAFYGERNQGYVNVGLTAMNFANSLHARGIGYCFMQWSNTKAEDNLVRETLGIPESKRIGLVLGAGYYMDEVKIPQSTKKGQSRIYTVL